MAHALHRILDVDPSLMDDATRILPRNIQFQMDESVTGGLISVGWVPRWRAGKTLSPSPTPALLVGAQSSVLVKLSGRVTSDVRKLHPEDRG